jgi:hypothetical protein
MVCRSAPALSLLRSRRRRILGWARCRAIPLGGPASRPSDRQRSWPGRERRNTWGEGEELVVRARQNTGGGRGRETSGAMRERRNAEGAKDGQDGNDVIPGGGESRGREAAGVMRAWRHHYWAGRGP